MNNSKNDCRGIWSMCKRSAMDLEVSITILKGFNKLKGFDYVNLVIYLWHFDQN